MAGVGKSHIAEKIAAISNYEYMETDKLIAEQANEEGMRYLDLSDDDFLRIEKNVFMKLSDLSGKVIDTGASVIYDQDVMHKIAKFLDKYWIQDRLYRPPTETQSAGLRYHAVKTHFTQTCSECKPTQSHPAI